MTVVRELVTRLGFQVDNTGIQKFERSILSFKTKFILLSGIAGTFAKKTLDTFQDFAEKGINIDNLAKKINIATADLVAMSKAAEQFQLKPEQFQAGFEKLGEDLRNATAGFGNIFEILRKSAGKLDLRQFAINGDVVGAFKEISKYISTISNRADKIHALEDIFGADKAQGFLNIIEAVPGAFDNATESFKDFGKSFEDSLESQKQLIKNLFLIQNEVDKIKQEALKVLAPIVVSSLQAVNSGIELSKEEGGFSEIFKHVFKAIAQPIDKLFGYDELELLKQNETKKHQRFLQYVEEYKRDNGITSKTTPNIINNNVTINATADIGPEYINKINEKVTETMIDFSANENRKLVNENPQVE